MIAGVVLLAVVGGGYGEVNYFTMEVVYVCDVGCRGKYRYHVTRVPTVDECLSAPDNELLVNAPALDQRAVIVRQLQEVPHPGSE